MKGYLKHKNGWPQMQYMYISIVSKVSALVHMYDQNFCTKQLQQSEQLLQLEN